MHSVPFVGRDDVLVRFDLALAEAAAGQGSLLLIYGEAGIGKTRVCEQIGRAHRDGGGQALLGRAAPDESVIAFGALADALREARRSEPALSEAAAARADILSAIAPELTGLTADGQSRAADRPVVFEALLDVVEEAAPADRATLWVLDDVHWADDASWQFVRHAARRIADMNLVLAVTYRDAEIGPASPRWADLVQLKSDPRVLTMPLRRLTPADAGRLVRALAPALPPGVTARIIERGAGTPLLIEELASLAGDSGEFPARPDIVRVTVQQRAARLGPAARDLLDVAAVAGGRIEARVLQSLRPDGEPGELTAARLLAADGTEYRFRHPLLAEAAYQNVPPPRRSALHAELAAALSGDGQVAAERVAGHLHRAGQPRAALRVLERGVRQTQQAGDLGRSATLCLAAFRLAHSSDALRASRAALEGDVIRRLFMARRWTELDPLVRDAWTRRDQLPDPDRARLATAFAWHLFSRGSLAESWGVIQEELGFGERTGAIRHAGPLLSTGGYVAWLRGDAELARQLAERGLEVSRRSGNPHALWWATHHRIHVGYRLSGDREAAISAFSENAASARALGLTDGEAIVRWDLACHTAAAQHIEAGLLAAGRAGAQPLTQDLQVLRAAILLMEGQPDAAESLLVRFGHRVRLGEPVAAPWVAVSEALLHLHRGELTAARRALHGPVSATEASRTEYHMADRAAALGWLAWEEGRWADAVGHLNQSVRLRHTGCWHTLMGGPGFLPLHVDALCRLGSPAEAGALIDQSGSTGDGAVAGDGTGSDPAGLGASPAGPGAIQQARFFAAAVAAARFRLEPSPELASAAQAAASAAPWPWLAAHCGLWRAELLGDGEAAAAAAVLFEQIGARRGAQAAGRLLRRLGVRPAGPDGGPEGGAPGPLSARETEVARLVAEGLSNPAIAARLYLSRPTVASHITHILTKLGCSSRAQIAAWVASQRGTGNETAPG
jgi:DNA-binding CsgD family transcriptional regulator